MQFQFDSDPGIGPGVEREVLEVLAQGMVDPGGEGNQAASAASAAVQKNSVGILTQAPDLGSYLPRLPITPEVCVWPVGVVLIVVGEYKGLTAGTLEPQTTAPTVLIHA